MQKIYTYSEFSSFKRCQRRHHYEYIERIRPKGAGVSALWVGSAVHVGLAAYYRGDDWENEMRCWGNDEFARISEAGWDSDIEQASENLELAIMMVGGFVQWVIENNHDEGLEVIEIEKEFVVPLVTPQGRRARAKLAGKVDGIVKQFGNYWLLEHKTATSVGDKYLQQLVLDEQVTTYAWAIRKAFGINVSGTIYNILRKQAPSDRVKAPLFYRELVWRNEAEIKEMEQRLYWTYREINRPRQLALPNPSQANCPGCPYRMLCIEDTPEARSLFEKKEQKHTELEEVSSEPVSVAIPATMDVCKQASPGEEMV